MNDIVSLSVCGTIFNVNKKNLSEKCSYFNSLLNGPFCESEQKIIELKGVPSDKAFWLILKYLENGETPPMTTNSELLLQSVEVADMFGIEDYMYVEDIRFQVGGNWPNIPESDIEAYLELIDKLQVTNFVTNLVFTQASNDLEDLGKHMAAICRIKCQQMCHKDLWERNKNAKEKCFSRLSTMAIILKTLLTRYQFKSFYPYSYREYFFVGVICVTSDESFVTQDTTFLFRCLKLFHFEKSFVKSVMKALAPNNNPREMNKRFLDFRKDARNAMALTTGQLLICLNANKKLLAMELDAKKWKWKVLKTIHNAGHYSSAISESGLYITHLVGKISREYRKYSFIATDEEYVKQTPEAEILRWKDEFTILYFHFINVFLIGDPAVYEIYDAVLHGTKIWFVTREQAGLICSDHVLQVWDTASQTFGKWHSLTTVTPWRVRTCKLVASSNLLYGFMSYYTADTMAPVSLNFMHLFTLNLAEEHDTEIKLEKLDREFSYSSELLRASLCEEGIILLSLHEEQILVELFKPDENFAYFLAFLPTFPLSKSDEFIVSSVSHLRYDYYESLNIVNHSAVNKYLEGIQDFKCIPSEETCIAGCIWTSPYSSPFCNCN